MVYKTDTTSQHIFHRRDPKDVRNHAIFVFDSDASRPEITRIILPEKSTWSPGPHWHEQHIEYFRVIEGRVSLKLSGEVKYVTPDDGPQRVDRKAIHDFCRADKDQPDEEKDTGDVVTEEWTAPADGVKHVFFRNLFSTLQDAEKYWGSWTTVQALMIASAYDDFVEVLPGRFSYIATHALYTSVWIFGSLAGFRSWHKEYTPEELRAAAMGTASSKLK